MTGKRRSSVKQKRVQQVKRQIFMIFIMMCLALFLMIKHRIEEQLFFSDEILSADADALQSIEKRIENSIKNINTDAVAIHQAEKIRQEAQKAGYPESVIELLDKNPETAEFVKNYADKKDKKPAKRIEELKKGEVPLLLQWDERWGYAAYGTDIIAVCGCGPTTLSMVFSALTGDDTITPAKLAEYGTKNNYITEENDTKWSFMVEAGNEWGISCQEKLWSEKELKQNLKNGNLVICSMGPGDFTNAGHFVVFVGYEDGKLIVHDSFSKKNSEKRWEYSEIKDQIKVMWTYSKS